MPIERMHARLEGCAVGIQHTEHAEATSKTEKQGDRLSSFKTGQDQLQHTPQRPVSTCLSFLKQIHSPTFCVSCRPTSTESARCAPPRLILLSFVANAFSKAAAAPLHPHPIQVPFALTAIRGLGRRFTTLACKKAGVNVHKRYSKRATCHALHARGGSGMEWNACHA